MVSEQTGQIKVSYADIAGFPGYRIGSDGSVWSQWVKGRWKQRRDRWVQLATPPDNAGYSQVNLYRPQAGGKKHAKVHILVAEAFLGPRPEGLVIRHLNGDPADNRSSNLRYGTSLENARDTVAHGRSNRGERCPNSKLDPFAVADILARLRVGTLQKDLAAEYGVSRSTVCDIVKGRTWAHLERGE